jgi:hypothetical protein
MGWPGVDGFTDGHSIGAVSTQRLRHRGLHSEGRHGGMASEVGVLDVVKGNRVEGTSAWKMF